MAKKEIFSRLNLKDYNNELELILDKKDFSSQVKNLLLSMFYKLETGYKDYVVVKKDSPQKDAFLESIMYIIKEKCDQIEIINPSGEQQNERNYFVAPDEKKISCYQNEAAILHAILSLGEKNFYIADEEVIKIPFQAMLKKGYELDIKEALTNFDGWAWNSNLDKSDDIDYYVIYELLRIVMGNNFMYEWKRDRRRNSDYLIGVKKKSKELYDAICKYCIMKTAKDKEGMKYIKDTLKKVKLELNKMEQKDVFLKEMYENKKKYSDEIKRIDRLVNDKDAIKDEFLKRNIELPEEKKIFCISDLEDIIERERAEVVKKMEEANSVLQPRNYLKKMQKLQEDIELIERCNLKKISEEDLENELVNVGLTFIEVLKKFLSSIEGKKEIIELVYKLRYFMFLPIKRNGELVEILVDPEIKGELEKLEKKVITKACKAKAIVIINQDINYNSKILQKILNTKIIEMSNISVSFEKEEKEILIEIYDDEVLERTEQIKKDKERDFRVRFGKKVKIFT